MPSEESTSQTHTGSCLCSAVHFVVRGAFDRFFLCHCEYCRKDTGSAHAANLFSSRATLEWVSGADKVRSFNLPSSRHWKSFCSICGSALPNVQMQGALVVVPAGALDSRIDLRPDAHLFMSSRATWDSDLDTIEKMATFPS